MACLLDKRFALGPLGWLWLLLALGACHEPASQQTAPSTATTAQPQATATATEAAESAKTAAPRSAADQKFLDDMNTLCRITTEVEKDSSLGPEVNRPGEAVRRFRLTNPSPEFLKFMQKLAGQLAGTRYPAMQEAARQRGVPDWSCPVLRRQDSEP